MPLFWVVFGLIVFGVFAFTFGIRTVIRWGNELVELQQFGVPTTGTVLHKGSSDSQRTHRHFVQYEYRDQFGVPHSRKVPITAAAWDALQEGGPIDVVYSERRPKVSAPKVLMDVVKTSKATITINVRE
jgi:hypothetical protein